MNYNNHATATVNLQNLQHNLRCVKAFAPNTKVLAMIKDNAYGHGAVAVARTLEGQVAAFGVIFLSEALKLHAAGIKTPIVILSGFFDQAELEVISHLGFETVVHCSEQISILEAATLSCPVSVRVKIDTGLHRLGFQPSQVENIYQRLFSHPMVAKSISFITHFSDAESLHNKTLNQLACFEQATSQFDVESCLANSAAMLNWPQSCGDWIRPGIVLYGVSPLAEKSAMELGLKPVLTLRSRIIATHDLNAGDSIGYGSLWTCPENMRIGVASIGYGDGYPRAATSGTPILVNSKPCALIGRVAMDMITIDLRNNPTAKIGDEVVLWGDGLPIEEIAKRANTISYELFCHINARVKFRYI